MKKRIIVLLTILCIMLAGTGIVNTLAEQDAPETLLDKVLRVAEDGENLLQMNEDDLYDLIGIEPSDYTDFVYLTDSDALTGREVILVRVPDEESAARVTGKLENYRAQRLRVTRNYNPEAYRSLTDAEVLREDMLIVLSIAAPDPEEADLLLQEE